MTQWSFLQWKFTACRYNLRDKNGFNTFSMSKGLDRDDEEDLIRRAGAYETPSHLPYTPTAEEIRTLFPVRFLSFRLRSRKYALVRTGFVGEDYAGDRRGGNFFSHALIFPDSVLPFVPILLWNSPLFAAGLSEEELQIKSVPPLLPQVSVTQNDLYKFDEELPDFLANSSRKENLSSFIQAVQNKQTGRGVILRDEPNNVPFWIAAVQLALPIRLACDVTFSTLALEVAAARNYHIAAVPVEGGKFAFDSAIKSTNFVFDFHDKDIAKIEVADRVFLASIATDEMTYPGKELQTVLTFMNSLDNLPPNSLEIAVLLYQFVKQNTPLDQQSLEHVLKFCELQSSNRRQELLEQILSHPSPYPLETLKLVLDTLCRVLDEQTSADFWNLFFKFFAKQFSMSLERLDRNECEWRFRLINKVLDSPIIRKRFLDIDFVKKLQESKSKDYSFLYLALICCLYGQDGTEFTDRFGFRPALNYREDRKLYETMISSAVSKAFLASVHKTLVAWGMCAARAEYISDAREFDFAQPYIEEIKKYGAHNWKNGDRAKPQAIAFIEYLLDATKLVRNQWRFCGIQDIFSYSLGNKHDQKKNVYDTIRKELHNSYRKESVEHFRTEIVGYKTLSERILNRLQTWWSNLCEFVWDNLWGVLITLAIVLLVASCVWFRSSIAGGCKYLWNKLPSLPSLTQNKDSNKSPSDSTSQTSPKD